MIVCLRSVGVPAAERTRYLDWIDASRQVREAHGLLAEWVLEPTGCDGCDGEAIVVTVWPSHEAFDAFDAFDNYGP